MPGASNSVAIIRTRFMWTSLGLKTRSMSQKTAELKMLRSAARGHVIVRPGLDQFEAPAKRAGKRLRIVAHDGQAAAPFGTVGRERRDDHVTTGAHRPLQANHI